MKTPKKKIVRYKLDLWTNVQTVNEKYSEPQRDKRGRTRPPIITIYVLIVSLRFLYREQRKNELFFGRTKIKLIITRNNDRRRKIKYNLIVYRTYLKRR